MARSRMLKPGFFKNEDLLDLPPLTRLLFAGLWGIADRDGRIEDRPKRIKIEVLPADDCDVNLMLWFLQASGFIVRYEHSGRYYVAILSFNKHQCPHKDERQSEIPPPTESDILEARAKALQKCGTLRHEHGICTTQAQCDRETATVQKHLVTRTLNLEPKTLTSSVETSEQSEHTHISAFSPDAQCLHDAPAVSENAGTGFDLTPPDPNGAAHRKPLVIKIPHEASLSEKITADPDDTESWWEEVFGIWWKEACWNRVEKKDARKAFEKCIRQYSKVRNIYLAVSFDDLMRASLEYLKRFEGTEEWERWRKFLHPTTFLNGARWDDEAGMNAK